MSQPVTDVEIPASAALPEIAKLVHALENHAQETDGKNAALSIMEMMLGSDDEETLFRVQEAGTVASKDFLERPFRLKYDGIQWMKSAIGEGGFPFYALLDVEEIETGERLKLNAGGLSVVAVLYRLATWENDGSRAEELKPFSPYAEEGGRPFQFVGRTTGSGYQVVLLKPVALGRPKTAARKAK